MKQLTIQEVYEGHYVPDGFFDPGYFVEGEVVAWSFSEPLAENYANEMREDGESGYEVFESDYDAAFHVSEDEVK